MSSPVNDCGALKYVTIVWSIVWFWLCISPSVVVLCVSVLVCFLYGLNILLHMSRLFFPVILIVAIAPSPGGVAIAAIVLCVCVIFVIFLLYEGFFC